MRGGTLAIIVAAILLIGCTPRYAVKVSSINDPASSLGERYLIVPGNKGTPVRDLQFQEYALYLHRALISRGYIPTRTWEDTDLLIVLGYGIGDPHET